MPLSKGYGVLKGRAIDREIESEPTSPHYQVRVRANEEDYRIAINVKSMVKPYDLLYFLDDDFKHPIVDKLEKLDLGLQPISGEKQQAGGIALDFIRGNLFDVTKMKALPFSVPGENNDLNELIELYIKRAIDSQDAVIYAFGEPWGPEDKADKIFGFEPGRGIHDIHMNQGNSGKFSQDNGVWQDGGLLIQFPSKNRWIAAFFAFQSQSFHTDDRTGHPLSPDVAPKPTPTDPTKPAVKAAVKIIAALVNPIGDDVGKESVTLINISPEKVDLKGWAIADNLKNKFSLDGRILEAGATLKIPLSGKDVQLSNKGGIISLLDRNGVKVDGVSYTKDDAQNQGWTVVF